VEVDSILNEFADVLFVLPHGPAEGLLIGRPKNTGTRVANGRGWRGAGRRRRRAEFVLRGGRLCLLLGKLLELPLLLLL